jgi:hypothetical protein
MQVASDGRTIFHASRITHHASLTAFRCSILRGTIDYRFWG